ncbi:MAG: toxic anion resistance protein [Clostridiales bacterium]|nr:toxic anion resistance protein [Clostridiales bacterium]
MGGVFSGCKFKYQFRDYQARALGEIPKYLENDGKIHVVAAPGAGKTALGLQIMIEFGAPALVLAPTVALREQWLDRFETDFAESIDLTGKVSDELNNPKLLTVTTYQALYAEYSAVAKKGKPPVVLENLREAGVKTVILDEAHHLKAAWLDAANDMIKNIGGATTISLTATPPYDMSRAVWNKYIGLCGNIDVEITVPELVLKNNLAEHQDYVFFNYPDKAQMGDIEAVKFKLNGFVEKMKSSEKLVAAVSLHEGIIDVNAKLDYFLDNFDYYLAMLKFLRFNGAKFPSNGLSLSEASISGFSLADLETLLGYCLGPDSKSYSDFAAFFREVRKELNSLGAIADRKVTLSGTEGLKARITQNVGKLESIKEIIGKERENLGDKLKLVVIAENIYQNVLDLWGEEDIKLVGVIPIFAKLVRSNAGEAIVLTGEITIIPARLNDQLLRVVSEFGAAEEDVSIQALSFDFSYAKVSFRGKAAKSAVGVVSSLFEKSDVNVLVGSSALIGEGWDAPFVNALIMATSIASFVTSNQVRGRAIRTFAPDPDKSANIWHLVCMEKLGKDEYGLGPDFEMLKRRFEAFEGVGASRDLIDYGIERLGIEEKTYSGEELAKLNESTMGCALDRGQMRSRWASALKSYSPIRISKFHGAAEGGDSDSEALRTRKLGFMKSLTGLGRILWLSLPSVLKGKPPSVFTLRNGALYFAGSAVLSTLKHMDAVNVKAQLVFLKRYGHTGFYLKDATLKENSVFREAFVEMLSEIKNPRYVIEAKETHFAVPGIVGAKKENAKFLMKKLRLSRSGRLIYTRTPDGKERLLLIKLKQNNIQASFSGNVSLKKAELAQTDIDVAVLKGELRHAMLGEDEKRQAERTSASIDMSSPASIIRFGAPVQSGIAGLSDSVLRNVAANRTGEAAAALSLLISQIRDFDAESYGNSKIARLFTKPENMAEKIADAYRLAEAKVDKTLLQLEKIRIQMMKGIVLYSKMYDENQELCRLASLHIAAVEQKIAEIRCQADAHEPQGLTDAGIWLEKKLQGLQASREISLQMATQIQMLQGSETELAEKIQSAVANSIALWKSQALLALGAASMRAVEQRLGAAGALQETNAGTMEALEEVMNAFKESEKLRASAEQELHVIEHKLSIN